MTESNLDILKIVFVILVIGRILYKDVLLFKKGEYDPIGKIDGITVGRTLLGAFCYLIISTLSSVNLQEVFLSALIGICIILISIMDYKTYLKTKNRKVLYNLIAVVSICSLGLYFII